MNIFATSPDPILCAQALDDKRVVKMVLETGQIISSAHCLLGIRAVYRPTHLHHPCVLWAAADRTHLLWTLQLLKALSDEYTFRYGREHLTWTKYRGVAPPASPVMPRYFVNVTRHSSLNNVHLAYRLHLRDKWSLSKPKWTRRGLPDWRYQETSDVPMG
jgi:hypothetical protein